MIIHSSITTLILKSKCKIVVTDCGDYPVLHITITYTGIFSRNFSVVLHASLTTYYVMNVREMNGAFDILLQKEKNVRKMT